MRDTHLAVNDMLVDLSGGHVVVLAEGDIEVTLVVTEVEIGLTAVVEDIHLTVLGRSHGTGIDVHVRVDLDGGDL